jgi:predicted ATPase
MHTSRPPTNLPLRRTALIGRGRDLVSVRELVLSAESRLVTLTGVGGGGKTSLALDVARGLVGAFADGAWLAELAPLSDAALVPQAVGSLFGVREAAGRALLDALAAYLEPRHVLLVLDNCEHLLDACAALCEVLL